MRRLGFSPFGIMRFAESSVVIVAFFSDFNILKIKGLCLILQVGY